jgi:hypothetical protein
VRLWYFFCSDGGSNAQDYRPWESHRQTSNFYASEFLPTEGFFTLISRLLEEGIIERATAVVDTGRDNGRYTYSEHFDCIAPPSLADVYPLIKPGDIILARCGFKQWYFVLEQLFLRRRNWMLFYRANSNRDRWPVWDVILDDLRPQGNPFFDQANRMHLPFIKPVNPDVFYPEYHGKKWDLCIGASHIHDKKGQWRAVEMLKRFRDLFKLELDCIMPGATRHSVHTAELLQNAADLGILMPGMLTRDQMRIIYNSSRALIHMGTVGQNDRCVLEAMACGIPCIIGSADVVAPYTIRSPNFLLTDWHHVNCSWLPNFINSATWVHDSVLDLARCSTDLNHTIMPQMRELFRIFTLYPHPDRTLMRSFYDPGNGV